ncbi:hypothetical protein JKP88DRAFT_353571 [Tribonema minus]|uniref:Ubiquitin-like protease family profile domain-containing protein n=1 Tax=Tribonema minus TaxID=303371 RepID=A0A836CLK2_9STRA|nr:hypothetical protein JKP88DRAFT_353571 [Tribonema minus]
MALGRSEHVYAETACSAHNSSAVTPSGSNGEGYRPPQPRDLDAVSSLPPDLVPRALTPEERGALHAAFARPDTQPVVSIDGNSVSADRFFAGLRPGGWLNDEVINCWLATLRLRFPRTVFANTQFYANLMAGYPSIRAGVCYCFKHVVKWCEGRSGEKSGLARLWRDPTVSKFVVPVHMSGNHWVLVAADFNTHTVTEYDSLGAGEAEGGGGEDGAGMEDENGASLSRSYHVLMFLEDLSFWTAGDDSAQLPHWWELASAPEAPRHPDTCSCGVFAAFAAAAVAAAPRGASPDFLSYSIPHARGQEWRRAQACRAALMRETIARVLVSDSSREEERKAALAAQATARTTTLGDPPDSGHARMSYAINSSISSSSIKLDVRLAAPFSRGTVVKHLADRLGCEAWFHQGKSRGFLLGGSNDAVPTVSGSADKLLELLSALLSSGPAGFSQDMRMSLRVTNMSPSMLCRLLNLVPGAVAAGQGAVSHSAQQTLSHFNI